MVWDWLQASFGPFYRIEQLILSTTPAAQAQYMTPSGLPAILTDANIRLLFRMQAAIDALAAPVKDSNATAMLQQVCFKPLGDDCATQSILQVSGLFLQALRTITRPCCLQRVLLLPAHLCYCKHSARESCLIVNDAGQRPLHILCVYTGIDHCRLMQKSDLIARMSKS